MPSIEWNRRWGREVTAWAESAPGGYYGRQWGDPESDTVQPGVPGDLRAVVETYIRPYVPAGGTVLEIGPGGGRWTKYLLPAGRLILVDLNADFLPYLKRRFPDHQHKFEWYQTAGAELDGIPDRSVDFVFTFGTFVHLEPDDICRYLGGIRRVLRDEGTAVVQYADKTKPNARANPSFSETTPALMAGFAARHGLTVREQNTTLLDHSAIIVLGK